MKCLILLSVLYVAFSGHVARSSAVSGYSSTFYGSRTSPLAISHFGGARAANAVAAPVAAAHVAAPVAHAHVATPVAATHVATAHVATPVAAAPVAYHQPAAVVSTVHQVPAVADVPVTHIQAHPGVIHKEVDVVKPAVKTSRVELRRPAIQKEFYDIEERVIVKPAGHALVELDEPHAKIQKGSVVSPLAPAHLVPSVAVAAAPVHTAHPVHPVHPTHPTLVVPSPTSPISTPGAPVENLPFNDDESVVIEARRGNPNLARSQHARPQIDLQRQAIEQSHILQRQFEEQQYHQELRLRQLQREPQPSAAPYPYPSRNPLDTEPRFGSQEQFELQRSRAPIDEPRFGPQPLDLQRSRGHIDDPRFGPQQLDLQRSRGPIPEPTLGPQSLDLQRSRVQIPEQRFEQPLNHPRPRAPITDPGFGPEPLEAQLEFQRNRAQLAEQRIAELELRRGELLPQPSPTPFESQREPLRQPHFRQQLEPRQPIGELQRSQLRPHPSELPRLHPSPSPSPFPPRANILEARSGTGPTAIPSTRSQQTEHDSRINQQRLIDLLTAREGVSEVGFGSAEFKNIDFADANVKARVLAAEYAPRDAPITQEKIKTRRIVVSRPIETVEEIDVVEPVTKLERVAVQQPAVFKTAHVSLARVQTSVPVVQKTIAPLSQQPIYYP